jgi:nucleoside-diphosphate-sugar epimerase
MALTLVTGAPGWIGTHLVAILLGELPPSPSLPGLTAPRRVRCLVLPRLAASTLRGIEQAEIARGDLRDLEEVRAFCRGAEGATLFHCAGLVHPARYIREFAEVNVLGTQNLMQAAEEAGVRRVVALSSNSVAGVNPRRDHRFDESSPHRPYMAYGRSKMRMEQVVQEAHARGKLETVVLRPTWFYGPGQPERQTTFFRMIRKGTVLLVGDGDNLRSMTYVDNLCQAMLLGEQAEAASGQTYWVSDRRPYSMNEIVDTVERLMEAEFDLRVAHRRLRLPSLAGDAAHLADLAIQGLGLYQQEVHVLSEMGQTIACSVEKAERELGYAPAIDLEEGMRRSLAWCVAQGLAL